MYQKYLYKHSMAVRYFIKYLSYNYLYDANKTSRKTQIISFTAFQSNIQILALIANRFYSRYSRKLGPRILQMNFTFSHFAGILASYMQSSASLKLSLMIIVPSIASFKSSRVFLTKVIT